jgi:hypothetical protein
MQPPKVPYRQSWEFPGADMQTLSKLNEDHCAEESLPTPVVPLEEAPMSAIDRYLNMGKDFISKVLGKTKRYGGNKPGRTPAPADTNETRRRTDATRKPDPPSVPPRA